MVTTASATLRLITFWLLIPKAVSFHSLMCRDPLTPMVNSSECVRREYTSPFRLHVTKDHSNISQAGSEQYKVEISSKNSLLKFATAQIAVVKTESCGYGELTFTRTGFYKEEPASRLCPLMLITKSSEKMHQSPSLLWKPPPCGCVQFRVLVFEDPTGFYSDDSNTSNGHLTTTVCIKKQESRKQYIKALCRVRTRYTAAEIVNRDSFKIRHSLRDAAIDKRSLVALYEARLTRVAGCCSEDTLSSQERCLDRTRFHRVDRLCEDGIPDLSFTALRRAHTRDREKKCCFIMGVHRYTCFNHRSEFPANSTEAGILDYSLDETDPINDLSDIATPQDGDILSMLSSMKFGVKFESDESESINMKDIGSKRVSSEERSTFSQERADSKVLSSEVRSEALHTPSLEVTEQVTAVKPTEEETSPVRKTTQPDRNVGKQLFASSRRNLRRSSRRKGRKRRRNSGRNRKSGLRRRSNRASRESRRRGRSRRRSNSRERRRKELARARSNADQFSREASPRLTSSVHQTSRLEGGMSSIIGKQPNKKDLNRISITCCSQGSLFGMKLLGIRSSITSNADRDFMQHCEDGAFSRQKLVLEFGKPKTANICWFSFKHCCEQALFSEPEIPNREASFRARNSQNREKAIRKVQAKELSDETGEDLDFGGRMAKSDRESETRYQNMRSSQDLRESGEEEKDGPARHDEADLREEDEGRGKQRSIPKKYGRMSGASGTATEEIQDFDDRPLSNSRQNSEEEEQEGENDEEDDYTSPQETSLEKESPRRKSDASEVESSSRQDFKRYRNFSPKQRLYRNQRNRSRNRSKVSKIRRNSARGNSRKSSRQKKLRGRNSLKMLRSLENSKRSNRNNGSRNIRRNSKFYSGANSKRRNSRDRYTPDNYDEVQRTVGLLERPEERQRRKKTFDSKEMAQRNRHRANGQQLVRDYYNK